MAENRLNYDKKWWNRFCGIKNNTYICVINIKTIRVMDHRGYNASLLHASVIRHWPLWYCISTIPISQSFTIVCCAL